jgi:hypothetical protein
MRPNWHSIRSAGALLALIVGFAGAWAAAGASDAVDDGAALMTGDQRDWVAEYHGYLLKDHDID